MINSLLHFKRIPQLHLTRSLLNTLCLVTGLWLSSDIFKNPALLQSGHATITRQIEPLPQHTSGLASYLLLDCVVTMNVLITGIDNRCTVNLTQALLTQISATS
jgi:hypothetical protein